MDRFCECVKSITEHNRDGNRMRDIGDKRMRARVEHDGSQTYLYALRTCPVCSGSGTAREPSKAGFLPESMTVVLDPPATPLDVKYERGCAVCGPIHTQLADTQRAYEAVKKRAEKAEHERDEARAVIREHQESAVRFATERDAALDEGARWKDRAVSAERHLELSKQARRALTGAEKPALVCDSQCPDDV